MNFLLVIFALDFSNSRFFSKASFGLFFTITLNLGLTNTNILARNCRDILLFFAFRFVCLSFLLTKNSQQQISLRKFALFTLYSESHGMLHPGHLSFFHIWLPSATMTE